MTKLTYLVNGKEITSYSKALLESEKSGSPLVRHYEPIYQKSKVDPVMRDKRAAAIRARAHQQ